jgi:hypothetical protein
MANYFADDQRQIMRFDNTNKGSQVGQADELAVQIVDSLECHGQVLKHKK